MDKDLYEKFKCVQFTNELVEMYTDIIQKDEAARKILIHIGKHTTDEEELGITIGQLVDRVKLNRRVQRGKNFVNENTNIDRKHVERVITSLQMMGLCYYRSIPPSKVINYTIRGKQIANELKNRLDKNK